MAEITEPTPDTQPQDDSRAQLSALKDSATKEYSLKNYTAAAELYSEATELQATLDGEMNPDNADLLYLYGRCLYHVAVSKSDVLGGRVAGDQEPAKKKRKTKSTKSVDPVATSGEDTIATAAVEVDVKPAAAAANKPFFQITGDENWTDSEDEDDEDEGDDVADGDAQDSEQEGAEEEDDDFAIAYEILDVARVLLSRKLETLSQTHEGKGKAKATPAQDTPEGRHIMDRLADTHDLQAEISLENERFSDAVSDSKASLELKLTLHPTESSLIAEAHYKLSLALEFASVNQAQPEGDDATAPTPAADIDEEMRQESISHMELAIESCKLRVTKEKASLASLSPDQAREKEKSIKDVTEMIGDMEQRVRLTTPFSSPPLPNILPSQIPPSRTQTNHPLTQLIDLRNPTTSQNDPQSGITSALSSDQNLLGGLLGSIFGESQADQKAKIEEATKTANDLTGLIKKKKKPVPTTATATATTTAVPDKATVVVAEEGGAGASAVIPEEGEEVALAKGKRKAEDGDEDMEGVTDVVGGVEKSAKKVKFVE